MGCQYHLYLDVNPTTGSLKLNFPDLEPWELPDTCALDIAERVALEGRGATLQEIGEAMNMTRERVRQIEEAALELLRGSGRSLR